MAKKERSNMKERTGELRKRQDGSYVGRIRLDDGHRAPWTDLCTRDETLAKEKLDVWQETGTAPSQAPRELFRDVATRFMKRFASKKGQKKKAIKNRQSRLDRIILPMIGDLEIGRLGTKDVARVLDHMAAAGAAKGTCNTALADMSRICAMARRDGAIADNPALDVGLPEDAPVDDRDPIILEDHEIIAFRKRGFETELDMMVLFCCELGGHRTSDLHAASWDDTDTFEFRTIKVRRPKRLDTSGRDLEERRRRERPDASGRRATRAFERVVHKLKGTVREALIAWWKKAGCPRSGPIFPVRRGPRAGQYKGDNISYAKAFREALWSEGIVRPMEGYHEATGEERRKFCALQTDTTTTRAADFHSLRRWFATRLANAGLNEQDAMDLTGHSVASTHARYRGPRLVEVPDHALLPDGERDPAPVPQPRAPLPTPPAAGVAVGSLDPAALAAAVAGAVAQALAGMGHGSAKGSVEAVGAGAPPPVRVPAAFHEAAQSVIDPAVGAMGARVELRAIRGGKKT